MQFDIRNFRAVRTAHTDQARITMILGGNMAGKTAIINAIGAALTGDAKVYGATKDNIGSTILHHGTDRASVVVGFEGGGKASIQWPGSAEVSAGVPGADDITVGRVDPCQDYDRHQWADFIRRVSGAKEVPTAAIQAALGEDIPVDQDDVDELVSIADVSWDDAMEMAVERRKQARKNWERTSLDTWGTNKARNWVAPGYLASTNIADAQKALEALRNDVLKVEILSRKEGSDLTMLDMQIKEHEKKLKSLIGQSERIEEYIEEATAELAKYAVTDPLECPHCGEQVLLLDEPYTLVELTAAKMISNTGYREAIQELGDQAEEQARVKADIGKTETLIEDWTERKAKIISAKQAAGGKDVGAMITRREELASELIGAIRTEAAQKLYKIWAFWNSAADLLAPTGLRAKNIKGALDDIGDKIDFIQAYLFPDHKVALLSDDRGITLTFDGMTYQQLTWAGDPNSYMLRIQYMFQIIEAQRIGKDAPVLLDRLDTLERKHVIGLLQYLVDHNMQAVLARTSIAGKPEVDKLLKQGVGRAYWLEDGVLEVV